MTTETTRRDRTEGPSWASAFRAPEWSLVIGIVVVLGLIYVLDPSRSFFTLYSRRSMLHQVGLFGVLSVGAALVIISGGIDLSIGSVVALSSIVSAKLLTEWLRDGSASGAAPPSTTLVAVAIGLSLLMGLAIGLMHAFMINRLKLPPFIATLATMAGLRSLASILCQNKTINVPYDTYRFVGSSAWWTLGLFAVVATAASVMMGMSVLGRHLYAMGGNETAARLSGLSTNRLKAVAYGLSGMLAALGGILFTGRSGQADSRLGVTYELYAITAAVVGGCSLSGGVGSIRGTALGLLLIQIIIKGTGLVVRPFDFHIGSWLVRFQGIDSTQVEGLVLGIVIVLAVAFNQRTRTRAS
jgi:ribose/xylose/arabinose/galactoside ABC-type transport system permease subunit